MQPRIHVGRRKTAVARVKLAPGSGKILINGRELEKFFPIDLHRSEVLRPFEVTNTVGKYDAKIRVEGGGVTGQSGAIKLGIAPTAPVNPADAHVFAGFGDEQLSVDLLDVISSTGVVPFGADGWIGLGQLSRLPAGAIAAVEVERDHRMIPVNLGGVGIDDRLEVRVR